MCKIPGIPFDPNREQSPPTELPLIGDRSRIAKGAANAPLRGTRDRSYAPTYRARCKCGS